MDRNSGDVSRRKLISSALGSAAGVTAIVAAGSPAVAAPAKQLGGVAEVVDTASADQELLVMLRESGTKLRVQARDFGGMEVAKGDLVAVMPDFYATDPSARDALAAYPYLRIAPTGEVWSFDRTAEAHLVGMHS